MPCLIRQVQFHRFSATGASPSLNSDMYDTFPYLGGVALFRRFPSMSGAIYLRLIVVAICVAPPPQY